ncbi:MAG: GNAT family N-acetyltransferase [Chloroflexota bacterium]
MYELDPHDFSSVRALFQPLSAFQPFCASALAGVHAGRVLVDDPRQPRSGLLVTRQTWCYLAGAPGNLPFERALNQAIFERRAIAENTGSLIFTCHPPEWADHLWKIFAPRQPIAMPRHHYSCRAADCDMQAITQRAKLPTGFELQRLEPALLDQGDLQLPAPVRETLETWAERAHAQFRDFGFAAVREGEIVAWATVDSVTAGMGDIGFETQGAYRGRGLATGLAATAICHGLSSGLDEIHWTCAESNLGSMRIAEKVGMQRRGDYTAYLLIFDEVQGLAQQAYLDLQAGRYQAALAIYPRIFALRQDLPAWMHLDMGRAWAGLGEADKALAALNRAVEAGWEDVDEMRQSGEFQALQNLPGWEQVLARCAARRAGAFL